MTAMKVIRNKRANFVRVVIIASVAMAAFFAGCTKQTMKPAPYKPREEKLVHRAPGDTQSWVVEFPDSITQEHFLDSFDRFLAQYRTDTVQTDTISDYFHLRMLGIRKPGADTVRSFGIIDKPSFYEDDIEGGFAEAESLDSVVDIKKEIPYGGSVTIYAQRKFIDEELRALVSANPVVRINQSPQQPSAGHALNDMYTGGQSDWDEMTRDESDQNSAHGGRTDQNMTNVDDTVEADMNGNTATADSQAVSQKAEGYISIEQLSPRKLKLSIMDGVKNGRGQTPGSFDLVDAWTNSIKKHPAEGLALFRHVVGLQGFIHGREAVIPGFQVSDERSVTITLDTPDPDAITRLSTERLLPISMRMGPYFIKEAQRNKLSLAPNESFFAGKPYLQSASLILDGDNNPFVSYSLNKYDMMELTYVRDLNYARRSLPSSKLFPFSQSRYFLSVAHPEYQVRRYIQATIDARNILAGTAKVEGKVIEAIADTTLFVTRPEPDASGAQYVNKPLRIIYRADDPFSVNIAEKILADLAQSDLPSQIQGLKSTDYERALIGSSYDIAVGWVPQKVLTDRSEQLRLATMWFRDQTDEAVRYEQGWEIPLFSITRYVLCKPEVNFADGGLRNVYIETRQ